MKFDVLTKSAAVVLCYIAAFAFTSCDDDDDNNNTQNALD